MILIVMVGILRFMKRKRWFNPKLGGDEGLKHKLDTGSTSIDDTEYDDAPWRASK